MGVIRFLGQHKGAVALVMLLLALKAVCDLALPVFTSQIVDVGIAQSGVEDVQALEGYRAAGVDLFPMQVSYLVRIGAVMLVVAACAMVLDVAVSFVASRTGAAIGRDLRSRLFSRIVAFSDAEINRFSAASLITRGTNDVVLIQNVCTMMLRMVLYAPILAIGGVVMVMVTNPQLGWIVVVAVALVFTVIAVLFRFTLPRFKIMQKLIDRVNLVAREMLTGLAVVRAFNRDAYEEERFDDASRRLMRTQLFTNRAMAFMMPTMMLVMNLTSVAIVWFGSGAVAAGSLQTGDLIAFITYAMVIIMGCLMMGMISIMLPRADVAAQRVLEVLGCEPTVRDPEEGNGGSEGGCGDSPDAPSRADSLGDPSGTPTCSGKSSLGGTAHRAVPFAAESAREGARIEAIRRLGRRLRRSFRHPHVLRQVLARRNSPPGCSVRCGICARGGA
ncbi:ABC transporter permease [Adlercreutzia sp. R21]|uniref:ABC transporter permease n=1 Tax=Adlercreutzia wanghongyangiae TaxID=3111451 RepID=UPI002DBD91F1|nr:ABC transporter permease [Adlercreutzia sp. R21]MEC4183708.1 ABC transporter permease [Adlercreutzia sp. R21]